MRILSILPLVITLFALGSCAKGSFTNPKPSRKLVTKIKNITDSVETHIFYNNKRLVEKSERYYKGQLSTTRKNIYDNQGRLSEIAVTKSSETSPYVKYELSYANGELESMTSYSNRDGVFEKGEVYDSMIWENDRLTEYRGWRTHYKMNYNSDGDLVDRNIATPGVDYEYEFNLDTECNPFCQTNYFYPTDRHNLNQRNETFSERKDAYQTTHKYTYDGRYPIKIESETYRFYDSSTVKWVEEYEYK